MRPADFSAIVRPLRDASRWTAMAGLILFLAAPGAEAVEVSFGPQQIIHLADSARSAIGISAIAADLDGDGDQDVLSASRFDDKIAWYENTDGMGAFGPQQVITTSAGGAQSVFAADLDGDGDFDILSASLLDGKIAWYENIDSMGSFGPQKVLSVCGFADSVYAADLDGDGDMDILASCSHRDSSEDLSGSIFWFENTDGSGSFSHSARITTLVRAVYSVITADLDGDGDLDVLSASRGKSPSFIDSKIAWYENTDGMGAFGPQQVITTSVFAPHSVFAADLDGDGDQDLLSASIFDLKVAWYENTDSMGSFGPQQVITTSAIGPFSVFAADMDRDGDQDVLSASYFDDKIAWYENTDGMGAFGPQRVINLPDTDGDSTNGANGNADGAQSVFAADLDGDGDLDVLSASDEDGKIAWYENLTLLPNRVPHWELYD